MLTVPPTDGVMSDWLAPRNSNSKLSKIEKDFRNLTFDKYIFRNYLL